MGYLDPPDSSEIAEQNRYLLKRQENFQRAAEYAAEAFAEEPAVRKVALFGSVPKPLKEEIPRFSRYRRAGIAVLHECKDVDLAIWVDDLGCLKALGRARGRAVNRLLQEHDIGVAHHQLDVFILEPETDRYLGRLCTFKVCPKEGKTDCLVPGCGKSPFLRQMEGFSLDSEAVKPGCARMLYERE